jgi:glycosyltransferase involved in cell wall biosynthesis
MASGCLVLASSAASVPEVAGEGALIFDSRDVGAIEETMERALSLSPAENAALVDKARSDAERFRPERFVAQTLEVYERVRAAGQA